MIKQFIRKVFAKTNNLNTRLLKAGKTQITNTHDKINQISDGFNSQEKKPLPYSQLNSPLMNTNFAIITSESNTTVIIILIFVSI